MSAKKSAKIPGHDSWIAVEPGASLFLDERLHQEWTARTANCRLLRGNALASCFEIEFVLDRVIVETMIRTSSNTSEQQGLFDDLYLKASGATFARKIDVLRKLLDRISELQKLLPADIIKRLTAIRELRNDFAHYPVEFEPVGDPPNQTLRPVLVSRRGRLPLDDAFLEEQGKMTASVCRDLMSTVAALRPETNNPKDVDDKEKGGA